MKNVEIVKSTGEKQSFSWHKVYRSVKRVGGPSNLATQIADKLQEEVQPGWTTLRISRRVRALLKQRKPSSAIKFNLFWAMTQLGPTGFPFQKYIARVFEAQGFKVVVEKWAQGKCVRHAVDFIADNGRTVYIGECKYHNTRGIKTNIDSVLHYFARFSDIQNGSSFTQARREKKIIKTMLITNTQFTTKAIKYARCVGQELWGWNYPHRQGLETIIDARKVYPITILPSFRGGRLMQVFSEKGLTLARDVLDKESYLKKMNLSPKLLSSLQREAHQLFEEKLPKAN